jgi:dienelactone hydrolase
MTRHRAGRSLALALVIGLTGCAADIPTLQKRLEPHYRLDRPQGQGPFAAVLLVPGCGGISPARLQTARQLVKDGYVVAFVDYLGSRGLQTACRGEVRVDEVVQDIRAASAHVRSLPYVRPTGVGAVGWSFGGGGVLASLAASAPDQAPFNAAAAFYPVCAGLQPWKSNVPVLLLLGGQDDIAPAAPCQTLVRGAGPAAPVVVHMYPNARHSFDMSDLPPMAPSRAFAGKTVGYDAEATRQAWAHVATQFDRQLRQSK